MKLAFLISILLLSSIAWNQVVIESSDAISDCTGATNILKVGSYRMQFTGKAGKVDDFTAYPSLKDFQEKNSLWCSFKATVDGRFTLNAISENGPLKMIVFDSETKYPCEEISKGTAEIRRIIDGDSLSVGLSLVAEKNVLYPIDLYAGQEIMVCFLAPVKSKEFLDVYFDFEPITGEMQESFEGGKLVDLRADKSHTGLKILVRDVETGKPVISNVTVIGIKNITAMYQGSDFYMDVDRSGKITIRIDAEGYFFTDREEPVSYGGENEVVIWLEPLGEGKSMQIDEIEFYPGSSEFLSTAEPKLRRLRDFLALNSNVKVEIQGHVHATGENTFAGQKLSEARAKRVMMYLVQNGISKDRLISTGFGNTKPIFPEAKFSSEEQANRRVEIKVL
jgi:outer membrane protein OmpA-like peptidoglycan-associated protein